ncbi:MAG: DUF937 domain-containing protein [Candidatus Fermentibacteraceae bacterium]|nr:DUF937 domain-containing protein [Candidatus Fermentibacteraceae bacterium]MBN2608570.1 DUF937 domain-containing protein [Candidatus Fermentibacteraceae bacterium]
MVNLGGNLGKALGSLVGGALSGKDGNPLGSLLGSLGGDDEEKETNMLASVLELVQKSGGVTSVIEMFSSNGLGQKAQSWVGGGPNEDLEPEQVQQVFGGSLIGKVASALGVNSGQASSVVAKLLPEVVNQITPKGEVSGEQDNLISKGLSLLGI